MAEYMNQSGSNMEFGNDPDYGLPEVTLTPIERGGIGRRQGTVRSGSRYGANQEKKSNAALIVSLLFGLLIVLAVLWFFFGQDMFSFGGEVSQDTDNIENTTPEDQNSTPLDTGVDSDADSDELGDGDPETGDGDPNDEGAENLGYDESGNDVVVGAGVEAGTFNVISNRTGRTYVIIGSFFDEDLARDYAAKLGKQGISTTLIIPSGNNRFYRLSIADFDTITEAINNLEGFRAEYGSSLWIIKH